jgi:hypothetical protein
MLIPRFSKKRELLVDGFEEKVVKQPDMTDVVYVQAIPQLKLSEYVCPKSSNLCSDVDP